MRQGLLGERLRLLRAQRGLTLLRASEQLGIDRHTLSRLEHGTQRASFPTLKKIADGYGVGVEDLMEEPTAPLAEAPQGSGPLSGYGIPKDEWRSVGDRHEWRYAGDKEEAQTLTLENVRRVLEEQVGTSLLALPEEEWKEWWRRIPQEEARERRKQIIKEWEFLKPQFVALTEGKPSLLPRRGPGGVFLKLWKRALIEAPESFSSRVNEPEQAFKRRQWEDRPLEWTEVEYPQVENAPDEASGAEAG